MKTMKKELRHLVEPLRGLVQQAFDAYGQLPLRHKFSDRTRANVLHDLMCDAAKSWAEGRKDAEVMTKGNLTYLGVIGKTGSQFGLRLKKLDDRRVTAGRRTTALSGFLNQEGQMRIPFDGEGAEAPSHYAGNLVLGYQLDEFGTLAKVWLTKPKTDSANFEEWALEPVVAPVVELENAPSSGPSRQRRVKEREGSAPKKRRVRPRKAVKEGETRLGSEASDEHDDRQGEDGTNR